MSWRYSVYLIFNWKWDRNTYNSTDEIVTENVGAAAGRTIGDISKSAPREAEITKANDGHFLGSDNLPPEVVNLWRSCQQCFSFQYQWYANKNLEEEGSKVGQKMEVGKN